MAFKSKVGSLEKVDMKIRSSIQWFELRQESPQEVYRWCMKLRK